MKQIFGASFAIVFLAALAGLVSVSKHSRTILPIVYAQSGCTYASLASNYAFTLSGWATPPPKVLTEGKSSIPIVAVGIAAFDGAGNWTTTFTYSHNGDISSAISVPGTYTVNSNCTGTLTGAAEFSVVIVDGGAEITGVGTDNDTTSTITMRKQNATGCSNSTLTGNYAITLAGFGTPSTKLVPANPSVPLALAGLATFDGAGNLTVSFTSSDNGDISPLRSDAGSYTVSSDCAGTITDETAGVDFATVVLAGGTEVFGVQTDVGTAATFELKKQ